MKNLAIWLGTLLSLVAPAAAVGQGTDASAREAAALELLPRPTIINPTEVTVEAARARVRARPRDADAWHQLGESLDVAGDLDEAVAAYERATRLPPRVLGRAFLYRDLADALERAGELDRAVAAARVSVRSWPLSRDGLHCMGHEVRLLTRLLVKTHDLAGAAAFYAPLYEADPQHEECQRLHEALSGTE
ncbi:MAG TPA: tetratricopeptide repeat protein [Allosphingosinicella sp.]|nr:tetratricopeptide repeat protein [Allosphingosinicella sp.]